MWRLLFRLGLGGFAVALLVGGIVSIGELSGLESWPLREGDGISEPLTQAGLGLLLICGIALLVPNLRQVYRRDGQTARSDKYLWTLFLVFFPYLASYIYFFKYQGEMD